MARTRRTVKKVIALTGSLIISALIFFPLLMGRDQVGGSTGKTVHPVALVILRSDAESGDQPVSENIFERIEISDDADSDDITKTPALDDFSARQSGEYLPVALLTQRPAVLQDIDPELPESLCGLQEQSLQLLLLINEYGDIDQVKLASAAVLSASLLNELQRHFQVMRFIPGRLHDRAVRSALRIRVHLHP